MSTNEQLVAALEAARNGLEWWADMFPEHANGSDDEMRTQIDEALAAYRTSPPQVQRAGLTDELIDKAIRDQWATDYNQHLYPAARSFARTIEAELRKLWGISPAGVAALNAAARAALKETS